MPTDSFYHDAVAFFKAQQESCATDHKIIATLSDYYDFSAHPELSNLLIAHPDIVECLVKIMNPIFKNPNSDIITRVCDMKDQIITRNGIIMSESIIHACLTRPIIRNTVEYLLQHQLPLPTPLEIISEKLATVSELIRKHQSIISAPNQGKYRQNLITQITIALSHIAEEATTLPELHKSFERMGMTNTPIPRTDTLPKTFFK